MSRIAIIGVALSLSLSACVLEVNDADGDIDGSGDGSDDGSDTDILIAAQEGRWFYEETTPVSSTCPTNLDTGEEGHFLIAQSSTAGFRVIPNDGTDPFPCTLSGAKFSCPERASHVEDFRPSVDAVVTVHAIANGTLSSSTRATGRQQATVDCAGSQCGSFGASLPCAFTVDYVIRAY